MKLASKTCTKCKSEKPCSDFPRDSSRKDGLRCWCKACAREAGRAYYSANADKELERARQYREENRDRLRSYARQYRTDHPEIVSTYKDRTVEQRRQYANAYAAANKAKRSETARKWYAQNKERAARNRREWYSANPLKARQYRAKRRSSEAAAGAYSKDDIDFLFRQQRGRCACCGDSICGYFEVDHVLALSKGGANLRDNLQLLCMTCNRRKGTKDSIQFMQEMGRLL